VEDRSLPPQAAPFTELLDKYIVSMLPDEKAREALLYKILFGAFDSDPFDLLASDIRGDFDLLLDEQNIPRRP
jgi:hypothetical protein